jgi:hypothetical protein
MNRRRVYLGALFGLGCVLDPGFSQNRAMGLDSGVAPLRVMSTSVARAPTFPFNGLFTLDDTQARWSGGALVVFEKSGTENPIVHSFDKDGRDTPATVSIPEAAIVNIESVTQGSDGSLGVSGFALDQAGHRAGFVSIISPDRQSNQVIRLPGLYVPNLIAMGADGSLWVEGWEPNAKIARDLNWDAPVMRRFDKNGKLQNQFLSVRSALKTMWRPFLTSCHGYLAASSTRVGWHQGATVPYFEFLVDGTTVQYPGVPMADKHDMLLGLAITEQEKVFATVQVWEGTGQPTRLRLYTLNRDARQWERVSLPDSPELKNVQYLVGAQGDTLVFSTKEAGVARFVNLN